MKQLYLLTLSFLLLTSCDDGIDCALHSPIVQNLFIKLTDADGMNLIENDTFDSDDIVVRYNDLEIANPVFNNVPSLENLIVINIHGPEGNISYDIVLSDERSDTLIMDLDKLEDLPCGDTLYSPQSITYNSKQQTIEDFNGDFLITLVLE